MPNNLDNAVKVLLARAADDPELAAALRALARAVLAAVPEPETTQER